MSNPGTATSPRIVNDEVKSWTLNEHGRQLTDGIKLSFDNLLSEIKENLPEGNNYRRVVCANLEKAAMLAVKGIASQRPNQA